MSTQSPGVATASLEDLLTDDSIRQSETELIATERNLARQVGAVSKHAAQLSLRLSTLQEAVSQRYLDGLETPGFLELMRRSQQAQAPALNGEEYVKRSRQARLDAIRAREECLEALNKSVEDFKQELQGLAEQLNTDEVAFSKLPLAGSGEIRTPAKLVPKPRPGTTQIMGAPPPAPSKPPTATSAPPPAASAPPPAESSPSVVSTATSAEESVESVAPVQQASTLVPPLKSAPEPQPSEEKPEPKPEPKPQFEQLQRHARKDLQAVVSFESENNFFTGFSSDISEGGIFIATIELLPVGSEVQVSFSLPTGFRADITAIVRWVREHNDANPDVPPGMGVQFINLSDDVQNHIQGFVETREPLFYDTDDD